MGNLRLQAKQAQREADRLWAEVGRRNRRKAKYWSGRFVETSYPDEVRVDFRVTDEGHKELARFGKYYDEDNNSLDIFYDKPNGVALRSMKKYVCGVCGVTAWNHIEYGGFLGPRYAVCPKHDDFMMIMSRIFKAPTPPIKGKE